jgi:hypothetical protein
MGVIRLCAYWLRVLINLYTAASTPRVAIGTGISESSLIRRFLCELPRFPRCHFIVSGIAIFGAVGTLITTIAFAVVVSLESDDGRGGCLGADFGTFFILFATFLSLWPIALITSAWAQRWRLFAGSIMLPVLISLYLAAISN